MKYILFDIDGTLTNTTQVDDKCYTRSFESLFKTDIADVQWNHMTHVTDWGIAEELISIKLNRKPDSEDIQNLKNLFIKNLNEEYKLDQSQFLEIEGATRFYKSILNDNAFRIGIATGGWEETAYLKLHAIGIDPHNGCYSNCNYHKSRRDITLDIIQQMNAHGGPAPDEIIYFGDGIWDYDTCRQLGIRFIGIDRSMNGKLINSGANEVYSNFLYPDKIMRSIGSK